MTEESTDKYYKELYGSVKRGKRLDNLDILYNNQKKDADNMFNKLKSFINPGSKICDFGGGAGGKTSQFVANKYKTHIIESDLDYLNYALNVGFLPDDATISYSLILLNHVLEHIVYPLDFLKYLRNNKIDDNGLLYIEVPFLGQSAGYKRTIIKEIHIAHKWYFTKSSLKMICIMAGFEIVFMDDNSILIKKSNKIINYENLLKKSLFESNIAILIAKIIKIKNFISLNGIKSMLKIILPTKIIKKLKNNA